DELLDLVQSTCWVDKLKGTGSGGDGGIFLNATEAERLVEFVDDERVCGSHDGVLEMETFHAVVEEFVKRTCRL
ncbi:hypothetical protein HDU76_008380, partial [Blyttiomyces sp. JEL0837]